MSSSGFVAKTLALAAKDLRVEARGRETVVPLLVFSIGVVLLLAFVLPGPTRPVAPVRLPVGTVALADVVAGFLWVVVLFAGLIGFARTFEIERDDGAIDTLLLAPVDRSGLFFAKALANLTVLVVLEVLTLPLFAILFDLDLGARWATLALVVALADLGFSAIGTLFSSLAANTRSRELILPVLALPALVPVFISATELTSDLFSGAGLEEVAARGWFVILVVFDIVSAAAGTMLFEFALE
jgi:heme exporter protein B